MQQLCPYEKVRENNIKERTELAKLLNINQLSKRLKEADDADESLLPMSDDEIYIIKNHSFFYCSLLIFKQNIFKAMNL